MEVQVKVHIRDYRDVSGDPPDSVLYRFHAAEKLREQRRRRWRTARTFAAWIWCGLIISYLCWLALK
jgi:hypothetical protein